MINNDLIISLNGYYYNDDLDDFNLNSLKSQSSKDFSILFIDPWKSDLRKDKIKNFEEETGIQSFYLPYERDFRARRYDWAIRNVAAMITPDHCRFFNYWQNRVINKNIVSFIKDFKDSNIGFARIWLNGIDCEYPFVSNKTISVLEKDIVLNPLTSCFETDSKIINIQTKYINYAFYDVCLFVEDFLKINGTDEALTSWLYE